MKQNKQRGNEKTGRKRDTAENFTVKDDMDSYDYLGCSCSAMDCTGPYARSAQEPGGAGSL